MKKRSALIVLALFVALASEKNLAAKGTSLVSLEMLSTMPFKFALNNGRFEEDTYGDKVFDRFAFPVTLSTSLGYIYRFSKAHALYGILYVSYNDDPVNNLLDASYSTKQQEVANFSAQSIDQSFTLGYKWQPWSTFGVGLKVTPSFLFLRSTSSESFADGYYNNQRYLGSLDIKFSNLHKWAFWLAGAELHLTADVAYSDFPNYDTETLNKGLSLLNFDAEDNVELPNSQEDFLNFRARGNLKYPLLSTPYFPVVASIGYEFSQDQYVEKPIQTDLETYDDGQNELITRTKASASLGMAFLYKGRGKGHVFDLSMGYELIQNDSTHNQFFIVGRRFLEEVDLGDGNLVVGVGDATAVPILFKDYKDYTSVVEGAGLAFNPSRSWRFFLSYHFVSRKYKNLYAKYGFEEKAGAETGTYKDELQRNLIHVLSLSSAWRSTSGSFRLQPFLGVQFYDSNNNENSALNYDLYFIGLRLNYDI